MSKKIDTLHPKSDLTIDLYPNIQSENIPSDAITTDKLASNSVTNDKINNGAITEDKIDNASITSDKIKEGSITTDKISDSAITSDKIKDYEITSKKLATASVRSDALIDNSIEGQKLKTGAVGFLQLEDNAVITSKIKDYNVTEDKLATNSVSSVKIQSNAITNDKINNGAVTEDKIDNASITSDKIKEGAITSDKIANGAVGVEQLQDESVTADKIATDQSMTFYDVDTSTLSASSITTSNLTTTNFSASSCSNISLENSALTKFITSYSNKYILFYDVDTKKLHYSLQCSFKNNTFRVPNCLKLVAQINDFFDDTAFISAYNNNGVINNFIIPSKFGLNNERCIKIGTPLYNLNCDISYLYKNNYSVSLVIANLENNTTYITSCSIEKSVNPNAYYSHTFTNSSGDVRILKILSEGNFMVSINSQSIQLNDVEYLEIERLNNILFLKWYDGQEYQVNKITFTDSIIVAISNGSYNTIVSIQY